MHQPQRWPQQQRQSQHPRPCLQLQLPGLGRRCRPPALLLARARAQRRACEAAAGRGRRCAGARSQAWGLRSRRRRQVVSQRQTTACCLPTPAAALRAPPTHPSTCVAAAESAVPPRLQRQCDFSATAAQDGLQRQRGRQLRSVAKPPADDTEGGWPAGRAQERSLPAPRCCSSNPQPDGWHRCAPLPHPLTCCQTRREPAPRTQSAGPPPPPRARRPPPRSGAPRGAPAARAAGRATAPHAPRRLRAGRHGGGRAGTGVSAAAHAASSAEQQGCGCATQPPRGPPHPPRVMCSSYTPAWLAV